MSPQKSKQDYIDEAEHAVMIAKKEAEATKSLLRDFPNAQIKSATRWRSEWTDADVNAVATDVVFFRTCGCCPDAWFIAQPYMKHSSGLTIYGTDFTIGEGDWDGYFLADETVEEKMREAGVNETVQQKIRDHMSVLVEEADTHYANLCDDDDDA